jgi:nucleoside-diphosphate-sugar epimerase
MTILVTGGAGFIGSHLVSWLITQGHRVRVLDNLSTGRRELLDPIRASIDFVKGDIRDPLLLGQMLEGVTLVFHLAAVVSVIQSIEQPLEAQSVNASGTLQLLEAARQAGIRRVVQASTCAVYGDNASIPLVEYAVPRPLSPYAVTKLAAEHLGQLYSALYGLEVVALRFFNVYGPGQDPGSPYAAVVPRFLQRLAGGEPITIFGDGQQSRDFVYVGDIVQALWSAAVAPDVGGEIFNVARGEAHSVLDLATILSDTLGTSLQFDFAPARAGEVRHSCGDPSRLLARTGFRAQTGLADGLALTVASAIQR